MHRRTVLASGAIAFASIAGCSALSADSSMVDVTIYNQTDSAYSVELRLYLVDGAETRSDARVSSETIEVEPNGDVRRADVAEAQRYLVRYEVYRENTRPTDEDHVHFYPTDDEDSQSIAFDIHPPGELTRRP